MTLGKTRRGTYYYKGRFITDEKAREIIHRTYRFDRAGRLKTPTGKMADKKSIRLFQEPITRPEKVKTGTVAKTKTKWQDGKMLTSAFAHTFHFKCLVTDTEKYKDPDVRRGEREHFVTMSSISETPNFDKICSHHADHWEHHIIIELEYVGSKRMSV